MSDTPTDKPLQGDGLSVPDQSEGPGALDQAYQLLGEVSAHGDALANQQQHALTQLAEREKQLQKQLAEADQRGDKAKAAQLQDELDELTRAWRVATEDTDEGTTTP